MIFLVDRDSLMSCSSESLDSTSDDEEDSGSHNCPFKKPRQCFMEEVNDTEINVLLPDESQFHTYFEGLSSFLNNCWFILKLILKNYGNAFTEEHPEVECLGESSSQCDSTTEDDCSISSYEQ